MKKKLFVSVSRGETSAYMVEWLLKNKADEYEMMFAFANTSKEREETLIFANEVDKHFKINLIWIEAVFSGVQGKGTTYKIVDFETAKRNGEVFEEEIQEFGLPNQNFLHCTRELKTVPLTKLAKDILGKGFYTAIGYRSDEADRINADWRKKRHYYPLIIDNPTTKPHVNLFWRDMPFRLGLKGYEGNCNKCWKKSTRKLMTIEKDERELGIRDAWWGDMEHKYGEYTPEHRKENRIGFEGTLNFYRNNLSSDDIEQMSKAHFTPSDDDSIKYNTPPGR